MISGIKFQMDDAMPSGHATLMRGGKPVAAGTVAEIMPQYRTSDLVLIASDLWRGLQAQYAEDLTPRPNLPLQQGGVV